MSVSYGWFDFDPIRLDSIRFDAIRFDSIFYYFIMFSNGGNKTGFSNVKKRAGTANGAENGFGTKNSRSMDNRSRYFPLFSAWNMFPFSFQGTGAVTAVPERFVNGGHR